MHCKFRKPQRRGFRGKRLHICYQLWKNSRVGKCNLVLRSWFLWCISLYFIWEKNEINDSLSYPLTPAPISLNQVDGNMLNSPKLKINLSSSADADTSLSINISIIDMQCLSQHFNPNLPYALKINGIWEYYKSLCFW